MKYLLSAVFVFSLLFFAGCSNDAAPTGTGGGGLGGGGGNGGGGNGTVTFQVATQQGQNGGIDFVFTPSTNVTLTQIAVSLPAQNFNDNVQGDGTTVFGPQNAFSVGEYNGTASGQQWTFVITGKIGSATGTAYNVTSNFTIP